MFKNQSTFVDKNSPSYQDLSQEKNYTIEDVPIHTMEKDLQEIENPTMKNVFYPEKPAYKTPSPELNDRQKSSPFLSQAEKPMIANEPRAKSNPDYSQINKAIQPKLDAVPQIKYSSGSKTFLIVIILLIMISIGAGAYYFIVTRQTAPKSTATNPTTPEPNTSNNAAGTEKKTARSDSLPPINASNPNRLPIDIAAVDAASLKKALDKSAQDVVRSGLKTPIEFILTDKQNNPINFSDFARMANITLSEKTLSFLEKDFSLFFFNDNGNPGLGLNLKISDSSGLKNQLFQEESLLAKELAPILPQSEFTVPDSPFQDAKYKSYDIRYQNLISPQKLSIDYVVQGKSLIFSTTKATVETILDKLNP
jgi:hypothetical protein